LAEIYLGNVCSCQEILRRNGRGQGGGARAGAASHGGGAAPGARAGGERNGCLNDAPCSPCTSHGASDCDIMVHAD
jgi:hypothetical protein